MHLSGWGQAQEAGDKDAYVFRGQQRRSVTGSCAKVRRKSGGFETSFSIGFFDILAGGKEGTVEMNQKSDFNARCYELLGKIPRGKVTTYKEMANALGTKAWRAVGSAMAQNNDLVHTPCHRVVRSSGAVGQYAMGTDKKSELLGSEGVEVLNNKVKNLDRYFFRFDD
jgi:methylated-DNA-[protein]-cysteine S-methyltransferase